MMIIDVLLVFFKDRVLVVGRVEMWYMMLVRDNNVRDFILVRVMRGMRIKNMKNNLVVM